MWTYVALWVLGTVAVVMFTYKRVTSHLGHRKHMAEMKQMFVDLDNDRKKVE